MSEYARRLRAGWKQPTWRAGLTGLSLGLSGVTLVQQTIHQFGVDPALTVGLLVAVWCGVSWGERSQPRTVADFRRHAGLLLAVLLLWPFWLTTLMEGVGALPPVVWTWPLTFQAVYAAVGLASLGIPSVLGGKLLASWQTSSAPVGSRLAGLGLLVGVLGQLTALAPQWGLWLPACVGAAALMLSTWGLDSLGTEPTSPSASGEPVALTTAAQTLRQRFPRGRFALDAGDMLACATGLMTAAFSELLGGLWPVSATLWHVPWGAVLAGWLLGRSGPRWSTLTLARVVVLGSAVSLALQAHLTEWSLWLNATLTSAATLELARMVTQLLFWLPCGWLAGQTQIVASRQTAWRSGACFLGGMLLGQAVGHAVVMWLLAGGLALILCGWGWLRQNQPVARWRMALVPTGLSLALIAAGVWAGPRWNPARPARLLFSTHVLLAARSGWTTRLLTHLDDQRLLTLARGRQGWWTVWQARGGEVQLRANGIPCGTLTTAPAWSPQYAPEVLPVAWPLVLVDQPARVLVLGARSGAALQAALVFPLQEVVCVEPDATVIALIRGPLARACGHDPFADDRCRWVCQPEGWLAAVSSERFDVIVSQPAPAALQAAAEEFTREFYQRAARQLAEDGIFCQRVTSIDFGPEVLLTAAQSLQTAFPEVVCLEIGVGEYLLLGARRPEVLVRADLPERLEAPHVVTLLARCQWDWSLGLNLPAYDSAALAEAAQELRLQGNSAALGRLPFRAARELMRWAPKLQEFVQLMNRPRSTSPVYPLPDPHGPPRAFSHERPRQGRYLEWLGPAGEQPHILRRLAEVVTHGQLVQNFPDTHGWEYRRELREQLQKHPRSGLSQVRHLTGWHPEDQQRKAYFEALGAATQQDRPTAERLAALETLLEPYDPLLTYFAHHELAELYARGDVDPAQELQHRLHSIYYAPPHDASVRNVVAAIDLVVRQPQALPHPEQRFDVLNGLLQTLRARWEARNHRPPKAPKVTLQEIERSLLSVERGLNTLQVLAPSAHYTADDWAARQTVLERLLLTPFRTYRDELRRRLKHSEHTTRALLQQAVAQ